VQHIRLETLHLLPASDVAEMECASMLLFANAEGCMPVFKLPLSGDVVQNISPFTAFMSPIGSQFGLVNITLGQSSAPAVEGEVLSDVGTYGKQIGQISDALLVLIERLPEVFQLDGEPAIIAFKDMLHEVARIKEKHHRPALRPREPAHDLGKP
jgi:hypothetical protein